ncbi:MAG: DAK2 domain-containing protein [Hominilimicola sp.]
MIEIDTLNGNTFAQMIISGANNLYNNKKMVDELNVFPVPDGDTGTNMSLTAMSMVTELNKKANLTLTKAADTMSFATLRGARGNSGVILSQFFRGISKSLKGKKECSSAEFALALKDGSDAAYKAVMKPTEGTILTVSREAAIGAQLAANTESDITAVMEKAVERGNKALSKTTQMLPALRQANVVDAGGQGWMFVLEGALSYLKSGVVTEKEAAEEQFAAPAAPTVVKSQEAIKTEDIKFRYCTEFIVEKKSNGLSVEEFRNAIAPKGDCMLVIDDEDIVKVHIHTNHPGFVLEEAIKLGEMINLKIDNMKHQHKSIIEETKNTAETPANVQQTKNTEPKAPKKAPKPKEPVEVKDFGFVAVCMGKGITTILKDLGVDRIIEGGQTMNPSTEDILKAVKRVKAKTVYVFPNNKNIIMAAQQAAELALDKKVVVIESTSIPQCISAMMSFNEKRSENTNTKNMTKALGKVSSAQLTYAVRDTEIDGTEIKKDDILGMIEGKITSVGKDIDDVLNNVVSAMVDEDTEFITVYYGKEIKKPQADRMLKALEAKYESDEIEVSFKKGGQPLYYYIVSVE